MLQPHDQGRGRSRFPFNRLFVHDLLIAVHHLRAVVSSLGDGLTAFAASAFVVVLARHGLQALSPDYRAAAVAVAASATAAYLHSLLARRLAFFRSNSVLADVALDSASARRYVCSVAAIACLAMLVAWVAPYPSLVASFLMSFWASLAMAVLLSKAWLVLRRRLSRQEQERWDRLSASRYAGKGLPAAAAGGAAIVFAAACLLDEPQAASVAALTSLALGSWFSPIAYSAIEYERLIGLSPARSLRAGVRDCALLGGALTGGAALSGRWQAAGIVLAAFALLLVYKGLEILMVRAVGGDKTRIAMAVFLFGLAGIAIMLPLLVPLLIPVCAWWLLAKGRRRTWQLS